MTKLKVFALALLVLALGACGSNEEPEVATKTVTKATPNSQLQFIPNDSPYVLAMVEPMPEEVIELFMEKFEPVFDSYSNLIQTAITSEELAKEMDAEERAIFDKVMARFLSSDGWSSLGFDKDTTYVLFGHGLLPVLRVKVSDGDLIRNFAAELETDLGETWPVDEIDGQSYWHGTSEKAKFVAAVVGDEVVMTVLPATGSDALLKTLLGLEKPAQSIADTNALTAIMNEYNYVSYGGVGYVDTMKIADVFLDEPTGINAEVLALMEYESANISQVCKTEIQEMAAIMPQIVTGYTRFDTTEMTNDMTVEIRPDLASSLAELSAPVPGVGLDLGGLFAMGMGFDLTRSIGFMKERIAAVEADPYECEYFLEMQAGLEQMKASLDSQLPPFAAAVKGFNLVFENIEFEGTTPLPDTIQARGVIAVDNAPQMFELGAMFMPQLAELGIEPDGNPVAIEAGMVPGVPLDTFVAMNEDSIGLSIGGDAEAGLSRIMSAATKPYPPIFSLSYDIDGYMRFMQKFTELGMMEDETKNMTPEQAEAFAATMDEIFSALEGIMGRTSMDLVFTEKGLKMEQTIILK